LSKSHGFTGIIVSSVLATSKYMINAKKKLLRILEDPKDNKIIVQAFNADVIYGKNHLISAFEHAKRAINRKTNTSKDTKLKYERQFFNGLRDLLEKDDFIPFINSVAS